MNMRPSFFRYDPENSAFSLSLSRKTSDKLTQTLTELINEQAGKETGTILKSLTVGILDLFKKINPAFNYDTRNNPMRCLTVPSEGCYNDGYDNINNEYILFVRSIIVSPEDEEYTVLELLGKGTFGQVVKCSKNGSDNYFAIKVIKNKPAYTNQALMEIKIYKKLEEENPINQEHIVKLVDYFIFRNHICLVFELLHVSLYDLLKLSNFSGFSFRFIQRLTEQTVDSLVCLERNKIIHCDLKPENILFADDRSDIIKLIDLGSSCFLHNTLYTYIQSRFYRAPEVIIGMKYTNKIDSWSLGCMVGELYLGLPLLPGNSEYDQLKRIIDLFGMPDNQMISEGRFKNKFFKKEGDNYVFKTVEEYQKDEKCVVPPHKKYFILKKLEDLELYYNKSKQREKNQQDKAKFEMFLHFLKGLLDLNPYTRWSASQARFHPFLTGEPFTPDWKPPSSQQALEKLKAQLPPVTEEQRAKASCLKKPATNKTGESYRPIIPGENNDTASKTQKVEIFNQQVNTSKPKKKLNINASVFDQDKLKIDTTTIKNEIKKQGSHSEPNSGRSHYFGKKDKYKEEPPKDQQNTEIQYHPPSNEENVLTIPENLPAVKFNVKKGQQKDTNQQGLYNQNPNQNFDPNQPNGGFNQHWSYPFPNAGNHPNKQTNYNNTFGDNNAYYQQVFNANYLNQYYGGQQFYQQGGYHQGYQRRQRSNSDHSENTFYQSNRSGNRKYKKDSHKTVDKPLGSGNRRGGGGFEESKDDFN